MYDVLYLQGSLARTQEFPIMTFIWTYTSTHINRLPVFEPLAVYQLRNRVGNLLSLWKDSNAMNRVSYVSVLHRIQGIRLTTIFGITNYSSLR